MKGRKVQGDVRPQVHDDPRGEGLQFGVAVVLAGDEQRGDFKPGGGLVIEVAERIEHRRQLPCANFAVKGLRKSFQVHVGRVHVGIELGPRFRTDVAGRDGYRPDAARVAGLGYVDGIFMEDHRIVVGESNAPTAQRFGHAGDGFRRGLVGQRIHLAGLADVPILTKPAAQVAACRPEGEHGRARQKMVQRLLLDGINAEATGAAVGGQHNLAALVHAHKAETPLPFVQPAASGTQVALHAPVG